MTGVETDWLSTNSGAGVYRFDAVELGVYNLTVAHPGFERIRRSRGGSRVVSIPAWVGAAETRIEVSGESSRIKDSPLRAATSRARRRSAADFLKSAVACADFAWRDGSFRK